MKLPLGTLLLIFSFFPAFKPFVLPQEDMKYVGFVVNIKGTGKWKIVSDAKSQKDAGVEVKAGRELLPGAQIKSDTNNPLDVITICLYDGTDPISHNAKKEPIFNLPKEIIPIPSLAVRVLMGISNFLKQFQQPDSDIAALAEDGVRGKTFFPDSMGYMETNRIFLKDLAGRIASVEYHFDIRPIEKDFDVGAALTKSPIRWKPGPDGFSIEVPGIRPGLYKLILRGDSVFESVSSYLLLLDKYTYEQCLPEFSALRTITSEWDGSNANRNRNFIIRSYLLEHSTALTREGN